MNTKRFKLAVPVVLVVSMVGCFDRSSRALSSSPSHQPQAVHLRFAAFGDWGTGSPDQKSIAEQICAMRKAKAFDVLVTTGDNFYPSGHASQSNFDLPQACLKDPSITWRAVWGNHDILGSSTGLVLGATQRYYRWSGVGADIFMLDSNQTASSDQLKWLRDNLAASTARVKIVVFHHPPYTGGLHTQDQGVLNNWVPLFERYKVTLVLNGHNHDYEHAFVNGIHYIVTGGGGKDLYPCVRSASWLLRCEPVFHFLIVDVSDSLVDVEVFGESGDEIDHIAISV